MEKTERINLRSVGQATRWVAFRPMGYAVSIDVHDDDPNWAAELQYTLSDREALDDPSVSLIKARSFDPAVTLDGTDAPSLTMVSCAGVAAIRLVTTAASANASGDARVVFRFLP